MAYFNRDKGGKNFGKKNFGGGFGGKQGRPFMHKATCAECGKEAEVPFKPVPGRPIYCSNCFENRGNSRPNRSFEKPRFENNKPPRENISGDRQYKEQFELLNAKLDAIIKTLASGPSEPEKTAEKLEKEVKAEIKEAPKKEKKTKTAKSKTPLKAKKKKVKV